MRLTFVNFIRRKMPHGYAFRGKYRYVTPVSVEALMARHVEYEREERNMLFLRHPYLTVEQSRNHMKDLKPATINPPYVKARNDKFERRFTWAEQLSHLRVKDAWD